MEENKIINDEVIETASEVVEGVSKIGTGLAMLIGGGITMGVIALGKIGKKVWDKVKAKKETSNESKTDEEDESED